MDITSLNPNVDVSRIAPEDLAGNTQLTKQQKIAEACRQFEAVLLRQILQESQKPVIKSKFNDNSTSAAIYRDQLTSQMADCISKAGTFGFASIFERQLMRPADAQAEAAPTTTAEPTKISQTTPAAGTTAAKIFPNKS